MQYHITTYGCQMNKTDSERIATVLEKNGYEPASKVEMADLIVVNMCSVRQSAVDRVFGLIPKFKKLKTLNSQLKTVLTGCILEKDEKKFVKNFDLILDIKNLQNWPQIILRKQFNNKIIKQYNNYLQIPPKYQTNFSTLIPISNGCDNFCSYCVVPYVRGREICRDYREILKETKNAIKHGAKEIWLLGQNVNSYKSEVRNSKSKTNSKFQIQNSKQINFARLLKMVNEIPGDFWIRFTSPHPKDFSDELIKAMTKCKKVTPYLNLPVQSGDNKILKKMNRNYTANDYKKLVKKIRKAIPEITLSTDVIAGFPGETKKQFENTAKLFRELKFDMAYISKYSPRAGTAATNLKDAVPHQEKEKRYKILTDILRKTALEKNKKFIGRIMEVLVETEQRGYLRGKTLNYKTIKFGGSKNSIGKFVKVKITDALPWGLKGKTI